VLGDLNQRTELVAYLFQPMLVPDHHRLDYAKHMKPKLGIARIVENEQHNMLPRNP
jgi:hypothetical protein